MGDHYDCPICDRDHKYMTSEELAACAAMEKVLEKVKEQYEDRIATLEEKIQSLENRIASLEEERCSRK